MIVKKVMPMMTPQQGGQHRLVLVVNSFVFIKLFYPVVATSDLVHNVEAIHGLF